MAKKVPFEIVPAGILRCPAGFSFLNFCIKKRRSPHEGERRAEANVDLRSSSPPIVLATLF
jgi:hypothetical protein